MSDHQQDNVELPDAKDSINTVLLLHDNGYVELEGPFAHTVDGWQWEVYLPINEDDFGCLNQQEKRIVRDAEGWRVVALADGSVESQGFVTAVDEIEDELILVAQTPGKPS